MVMKSGTVEATNPTIGGTETQGMLQDYENVFGPAARDIKQDSQVRAVLRRPRAAARALPPAR